MKWTIVLLALFWGACTTKTKPYTPLGKNDLAAKKLKGRVKTLTDYICHDRHENGKMVKGRISNGDIYTFDSNGNLIEWLICDEKTGEPFDRSVYELNQNGKPVKRVRYKKDGSLDATYTYHYNKEGYLIEDTRYNDDGTIKTIISYNYTDEGRLYQEYTYHTYNRHWQNTAHWYNAAGNQDTIKFEDSEGNTFINISTLDYKGNEIGLYINYKGKNRPVKITKEFDDNGEEISSLDSLDKERRICMYDYTKKDEAGNWLEATMTCDGRVARFLERKITYY